MTSLQILSFLKMANPVLCYGVGLTCILLMIRYVGRAEQAESTAKTWVQAGQAFLHCSIWFALFGLLDFI